MPKMLKYPRLLSGQVMAFDFGTVKTGCAIGNTLSLRAQPLGIISSRTNEERWHAVGQLVEQWQPDLFVVGMPRHPDGTAHEVTALAQKFSRQLQGRFGKSVFVVDERYSSAVVGGGGTRRIDDLSAQIILQQWFDEGMPQRKP